MGEIRDVRREPGSDTNCLDEKERRNAEHIIVRAWSLDEKMGTTYIHYEQANTLAQRDYKQPQMVIYEAKR